MKVCRHSGRYRGAAGGGFPGPAGRFLGPALATLLTVTASVAAAEPATMTNSLGQELVRIPAGEFVMGSSRGDRDEEPLHRVTVSRPFHLGLTEVTNAQYEQFDPKHRAWRGKLGLSTADDEAVIFVSWPEAAAFCAWLARKEGRPYRLPTEAEWEYACRAGTTTEFHSGDTPPRGGENNQRKSWYPDPAHAKDAGVVAPLMAGRGPPNAWGLRDMHGNVEEWCADWYGPYEAGAQRDPVGRVDGDFRVTRGGSHSTEIQYLRSANRLGAVPEDRSWLIGFRVALGEPPGGEPRPRPAPQRYQQGVAQAIPADVSRGPDPARPFFRGPRPYVKITPSARGPFFRHNHVPAITECPNGDLLAIWYSGDGEQGRELHYIASRLRRGAAEWEPASDDFFGAPDRNAHTAALWWDGDRTLWHFNGCAVAATWGSLALLARTSTDNGVTWSKPRFLDPEHGLRHMPVASVIRTRRGAIVLAADAVTGGAGGTAIWVSEDNGLTFRDPGVGRPVPRFQAGSTGAWAAGIHAPLVELSDGAIMALGRGDNLNGSMPKSVTADLGRTWAYSASGLEPLGGGQRCTLLRLRDGGIFLASFTPGHEFIDAGGRPRRGRGLYAAWSGDDGQTWSHRRLVTDDGPSRTCNGGAWTQEFELGPDSAEPKGYLTSTQSRDGVIHLISSALHYEFNLAWLKARSPARP